MDSAVDVTIDTSFVDTVAEFFHNPKYHMLERVISHPAAKKTHVHARRFGNTESSIQGFWEDILSRGRRRSDEMLHRMESCCTYLKDNTERFHEAFIEITNYLPPDEQLSSTLYAIYGYDIGIVSEGAALLNFGHPAYYEDSRELIYMSMHELHHVAFTKHNPIYTLADLENTTDLVKAVKYSTHLEGMAVYTPFQRRISENGLSHSDYPILLDSEERISRVNQFFQILRSLERIPLQPLDETHLKILEIMSGPSRRLWYITGAHIAETIDQEVGRQALVQTIIDGPDSFFNVYEEIHRS